MQLGDFAFDLAALVSIWDLLDTNDVWQRTSFQHQSCLLGGVLTGRGIGVPKDDGELATRRTAYREQMAFRSSWRIKMMQAQRWRQNIFNDMQSLLSGVFRHVE